MVEKMKKSDRAKIFMPFDALKGFREALLEKERIRADKKILSESQKEELNRKVLQIENQMMIKVIYFDRKTEEYIALQGVVTKIDNTYKTIKIVKKEISMEDILEIEVLETQGFANDV